MATLVKEPSNIDFAITRGTLIKPIYEMTPLEREAFYKEMKLKIRERLFKRGQPLVYQKDNQVVAEYADGTIKVIE